METGHEKLTYACIFCPNVSQVFASLKKLAKKFEPAQIVRKSTQVIASWWSNEAQVDTS